MRSTLISSQVINKILLRNFFFIAITTVGLLSSCSVSKESKYFKTLSRDTTIAAYVSPGLDSKIQKGDLLNIHVSSLSVSDDALYAAPPTSELPGYRVDQQGEINFHRLGKIKAEGLTRKELSEKIKSGLTPYLTDAIVSVTYLNHKITVAGDVTSPKIIPLPEEQMSIIDALVSCGDLKSTALRSDIMVIRDSSDKKIIKHVNLEDHAIISSSWYYLQPNDIVIVHNDPWKAERDERRSRFQSNFAIITSLISLTIIILSRFF